MSHAEPSNTSVAHASPSRPVTPAARPMPPCQEPHADVPALAAAYDALRLRHGAAGIPADAAAALVDSLPEAGEHDEEAGLLRRLGCWVPTSDPSRLLLASPPTASWASHVSFVRAGTQTLAVLKVFRAPLDGALRELASLERVRGLQDPALRVPRVFATGRARVGGAPCVYVLMDAPGSTDLEAFGRKAASDAALRPTYRRALQGVGHAMAHLHRAMPRTSVEADIAQARAEHVKTLQRFLRADGPLQGFVDRGWASADTCAALRARVVQLTRALEAEPLADIPVGLTHGDCYPANFVLDTESETLHMVDLQTVIWALSSDQGGESVHSDVREDLGRFRESMHLQGLREGLSAATMQGEDATFVSAYMATQPPARRAALMRHELIYRLRYDAVVFNAWHAGRHQKTREEHVQLLLDSLLRRLDITPSTLTMVRSNSAIA